MKYKPEMSIIPLDIFLLLGYRHNVSFGLLRRGKVPCNTIMSDPQLGWVEQAEPDPFDTSELAAAVREGRTCSHRLGGIIGESGDGHIVHRNPLKLPCPRQDFNTVSVVM